MHLLMIQRKKCTRVIQARRRVVLQAAAPQAINAMLLLKKVTGAAEWLPTVIIAGNMVDEVYR